MLHSAEIPVPTFVDDDPGQIAHVLQCAPGVKVMSTAQFKEYIAGHPCMGTDTETTGLDRQRDHTVFWSAATEQERFCFRHTSLQDMAPVLNDPEKELAFHNRNFDAWMLLNSGVDLADGGRTNFRCWDTNVMHTMVADNQDHDLKHIAKTLFGIHMPSFKEVFNAPDKDTGKKLLEAWQTDPRKVIDYASKDAWATIKARNVLADSLSEMSTHATMPGAPKNLLDYYTRFEMPMHDVLWHMEREGIPLDIEGCNERLYKIDELLKEQRKAISKLCGKVDFNPNSDQQVRQILFTKTANGWSDEFGRPVYLYTAGGESGNKLPSVKADPVLIELAKKGSKFAMELVRHNKLETTKGFLLGYKKSASYDGSMHTCFNQGVASTGRLSSSGPNLQNVRRSGDGDEFEIRGIFVPPYGMTLGVSDYGQLEMRITADMSGEEVLIDAINNGRDLHCWTAHLMFNKPYLDYAVATEIKDNHGVLNDYQKILISERTVAKTINFMIIYGGTEHKLASTLKIPVPDAKKQIAAYWAAYPKVRAFMAGIEKQMQNYWWVATKLGRRRQIPQASLQNVDWKSYNAGKREAGNHPVQGTGAEIVKAFQIRLFRDEAMWDAGYRQLLQVHDEIVGRLPHWLAADQDFVNQYEYYKAHPFGDFQPLVVPLAGKFNSGNSWLTAK